MPRFGTSRPAQRHTDGRLAGHELHAFLAGEWVRCRSGWLMAARYDADNEELWIRFGRDGVPDAEGYYENVSKDEAEDFGSAPSLGGFLHDNGFIGGRDFIKHF